MKNNLKWLSMSMLVFIALFAIMVFISCSDQSEARFRAEKQELKQKIQTALDDIDEKMSTLNEKAKDTSEEIREELNITIDQLQDNQTILEKKLQQIEDTSQNQWEKFKAGVEKTINDLQATFEDLES